MLSVCYLFIICLVLGCFIVGCYLIVCLLVVAYLLLFGAHVNVGRKPSPTQSQKEISFLALLLGNGSVPAQRPPHQL